MEAEQAGQEAATGSLAGTLANFPRAQREKTWDEMTSEQRAEKMREEVRYLRRTVTDLERTINKLKLHQHSQDGAIMVPLKRHDGDDHPRGYFYDPLK